MTPNDIIKLALKQAGVLGVGQTPMAEDVNDSLTILNMMLGQWNRKRWLVYHLVDTAFIGTGALSYSVGPGGNVNIPRPDAIEVAYVRLVNAAINNQADFPLYVIRSYEDYARIGLKTQTGFPQFVFLDTGSPLATLYVWPIPDLAYEIHIVCKSVLTTFTGVADDISLPPEYQEALLYNLAGRLRSHYAMPPDATITALARASINTLRNTNAQVPLILMPDSITGGRRYNVFTDR